MDSKELGFLFRVAVSCILDNVHPIRIGESDATIKKVMTIILNHLDLVETEDIIKMHSMIYSYFSSCGDTILADSISVDDYIKMYQRPTKSEYCVSFADLLMEELEKRADSHTSTAQ